MAKLGTISVERDQESPVEGVRLYPLGLLQVVLESVPSRKCANEDVAPLKGVDCDDLSGRV